MGNYKKNIKKRPGFEPGRFVILVDPIAAPFSVARRILISMVV